MIELPRGSLQDEEFRKLKKRERKRLYEARRRLDPEYRRKRNELERARHKAKPHLNARRKKKFFERIMALGITRQEYETKGMGKCLNRTNKENGTAINGS